MSQVRILCSAFQVILEFAREPFKEGMMDFDFFIEGFQRVFRIVFLGGPSFRFSEAEAVEKKIKVLAEY
jgi:hypothetical protein